ncbi:Holliday junction resolvase [Nitritalea halalkaliphila LW7]|uniref:Putative pre-16S rRNA nuclease n=1 Tax=Nitritalea halalkaliphila LW7 TaxID=1189621 RepID=I5C4A9_9BACT|nr:Holliday junction resolvase RuvX [Nitritalea halalkaliphila]EIM76661.1 Holliday junction resolvase [Nitritalea halalkaliphila LW7]
MGRLLAIDLGTKRTGLAVTDPLKLIANPLEMVPTHQLLVYLEQYVAREPVEAFILGLPRNLQGEANEMTPRVLQLKGTLEKKFPVIPVKLVDERFTSKMAMQSMLAMGSKKRDRKEKTGNLDKISATIILQSYLASI